MGDPDFGGDSSEVQDQLRHVQQIQVTERAFAAILADRSVVTWGHPGYGGDSSEVGSKPQQAHLPQSWWIDRLLHGAIQVPVVTAMWLEVG